MKPKFSLRLLCAAIASCFGSAFANPSGPTVAHGQAGFSNQGNTVSVTNTPGAIINWQSFSIAPGETTKFIQQDAASAVLNRVTGQNPSQILGSLLSNGKVFLINPNGIVFGQGAVVDVAGLVASTLNLSDQDFLAGKLNFTENARTSAVRNHGSITTATGGSVYLIAPDVENSGVITSPQGQIILAAGRSALLVDSANPELQVTVSAPDDRALNVGQLISQAGTIGIFGALIESRGTVNANSAAIGENGKIVLKAARDIALAAGSETSADGPRGGDITIQSDTGATVVAGRVSATGAEGAGGAVQILGDRVGLFAGAEIDVSGESGGGTALVGGDFQGNGVVQNAKRTYVVSGVAINADALNSGDGGKVIVWADESTRYDGHVSARGGKESGNGGFAEVSGKETLAFNGTADLSAPKGQVGTLLLDPATLTITDAAAGGTQAANLAADNQILAADPNIGANTISWGAIDSLAATANIVLEATGAITVNNVTGAAGGSITAIDLVILDLTTGILRITSTGGSVTFADTNDTIRTEGGAITLQALAGGATGNLTLGNLNTTGAGGGTLGNVTLTANRDITVGSVTTGGGTFTAQADANLNGSGVLSVRDLRTISTSGGAITITTDDFNLNASGALNSGSGPTAILSSNNQTIGLGATAGGLTISGAELAQIVANNLTIGNATNGNITVNGISAANSNNIAGVLTLNATRPSANATFATGASTFNALTVNAANNIAVNAALTADTGALTLNADSDNTNAGAVTSTAAGDINTTAVGAAGVVTVNTKDNPTLSGTITTNGAGISITNSDTGVAGITISDAIATAGGNVTLSAADNMTLAGATGDVSTNGGSFTVNADSDADGAGTYNQNNAGSAVTTAGGAVSISADDFALTGTINSGAGSATILSSNNQTIGLGATAGGLTISGAELARIIANNLTIGNATNGNITVNGISAANSNNIAGVLTLNATRPSANATFATGASTFNALTVNAANTIAIGAPATTDTGGASFTGGVYSQTRFVDVAGSATLNITGGVNVTGGAGPARLRATSVDVQSTGTIVLTGGTAPGSFAALEATSGDAAVVANTVILAAGAGNDADAVIVATGNVLITAGSCTGCNPIFVFPLGNGITETGLFGANITPPIITPPIVPPVSGVIGLGLITQALSARDDELLDVSASAADRNVCVERATDDGTIIECEKRDEDD